MPSISARVGRISVVSVGRSSMRPWALKGRFDEQGDGHDVLEGGLGRPAEKVTRSETHPAVGGQHQQRLVVQADVSVDDPAAGPARYPQSRPEGGDVGRVGAHSRCRGRSASLRDLCLRDPAYAYPTHAVIAFCRTGGNRKAIMRQQEMQKIQPRSVRALNRADERPTLASDDQEGSFDPPNSLSGMFGPGRVSGEAPGGRNAGLNPSHL